MGFQEKYQVIKKYRVEFDRRLHVDFEMTCPDEGVSIEEWGYLPEITEMGVVELNLKTLTVGRTDTYFIKNELSPVTARFTELTGVTQQHLKKHGRPFGEVLASFSKKYGPGRKAWCAWGSDKEALERDCARKGVTSPFSEAFFNMGLDFSHSIGAGRSIGLHEALALLGLTPVTEHHRAVNDAFESARIDIIRLQHARRQVDLSLLQSPSGAIPSP